MAARTTPSRGSKPDKLFRSALLLELYSQRKDETGKLVSRLRIVARSLVDCAESGDLAAIKEISNRVDGKVAVQLLIEEPQTDSAEIAYLTGAPRMQQIEARHEEMHDDAEAHGDEEQRQDLARAEPQISD